MPAVLDTLKASQKIRATGLSEEQAEAIVYALADIHGSVATREYVNERITQTEDHLNARIDSLAKDMQAQEQRLNARIDSLAKDMQAQEQRLGARIEAQTKEMTIKFGAMLFASVGAIAALLKFA